FGAASLRCGSERWPWSAKPVAIRNQRRLKRGTPFPVCRFTGAYRAEPSALRAPAKLVFAVGCILAIAGLFALAYRPAISKRGGTQLYPAFPYDHYTKLKDEDIAAIYAYLMTRDPVNEHPPRTALPFPYGIRPLMAGWKLLFLDTARFEPDQQKSEEWNRGAY